MVTYYFWRQDQQYPEKSIYDPLKSEVTIIRNDFKSRKDAVAFMEDLERRDNAGKVWTIRDQFESGYKLYKWIMEPFSDARDHNSFSQWPCNKEVK